MRVARLMRASAARSIVIVLILLRPTHHASSAHVPPHMTPDGADTSRHRSGRGAGDARDNAADPGGIVRHAHTVA